MAPPSRTCFLAIIVLALLASGASAAAQDAEQPPTDESPPPIPEPPQDDGSGPPANPESETADPMPAPPPTYGTTTYPPAPPSTHAQPAMQPAGALSGVHRHDGFMLRLSLGFGLMFVSNSDTGIGFEGLAAMTSIALGGAVSENLVLHGEVFGGSNPSPAATFDGEKIAEVEAALSLSGVGVGLTYFVMPLNLYISGTLGIANANFDPPTSELEHANGLGLNLLLGKEWWVGQDWGIGAAAQFFLMSLWDELDRHVQATAFGVLFSATYQ